MDRDGAVLSLETIVIIVLIGALIAIISPSIYENVTNFSNDLGSSADSNDLRTCEENIDSFCRFNPGEDWSTRYEDCTQYQDTIGDGSTTCPGSSN